MRIKSALMCFGSLFLLTSCPGNHNRVFYPYQGTYRLSSIVRTDFTIGLELSTDSYIQIAYLDDDVVQNENSEASIGTFSCLTNYGHLTISFFDSSFSDAVLYRVNLTDFDFSLGEKNYSVKTSLVSSDTEFADSLEMSIVGSSYSIIWSLDKSLAFSIPN